MLSEQGHNIVMEMIEGRSDGALSNLVLWKVTLLMMEVWKLGDL